MEVEVYQLHRVVSENMDGCRHGRGKGKKIDSLGVMKACVMASLHNWANPERAQRRHPSKVTQTIMLP